MTCREAMEAIHAHLDGEADGATKAALDRHTASCDRCRKAQADIERLFAAFAGEAPAVSGSAGAFADEVMARIDRRVHSVYHHHRRRRKRVFFHVVSPVAAAAVLALALLGTYLWHLGHAGRVHDVEGPVLVVHGGETGWTTAGVGQAVTRGDRFRASDFGRLHITVGDVCHVELNERTEIVAVHRERYDLLRGEAYFRVRPGTPFEVGLPFGRAIVRGTEFNIEVQPTGDAEVTVVSGTVIVEHLSGVALSASAGTITRVHREVSLPPVRPPTGVADAGAWRQTSQFAIRFVPFAEERTPVTLMPGQAKTAGPVEVRLAGQGEGDVLLTVRNRSARAVNGVVLHLKTVDRDPANVVADIVSTRGGRVSGGTRVEFDELPAGSSGTVTVRMKHHRPRPRQIEIDVEPAGE